MTTVVLLSAAGKSFLYTFVLIKHNSLYLHVSITVCFCILITSTSHYMNMSPSLPLPLHYTCTYSIPQSPSKALLADGIGENAHLTDNWDDAEGYYS